MRAKVAKRGVVSSQGEPKPVPPCRQAAAVTSDCRPMVAFGSAAKARVPATRGEASFRATVVNRDSIPPDTTVPSSVSAGQGLTRQGLAVGGASAVLVSELRDRSRESAGVSLEALGVRAKMLAMPRMPRATIERALSHTAASAASSSVASPM